MDKKVKVARLSVASNTVLTTGKLIIGFSMGSVSVISEGFHSGMDLIAAIIALISVNKAAKPADTSYQYGYGKYENLASIIEALLIVAAAGLITAEAYPRLFEPAPVHALGLGMLIMAVSACVNLFVSRMLLKAARETDSPALAADGMHLLTDVYTSVGVLIGVIIIKFTGWYIVDPLIGIAVSIFILKAAWELIRDSIKSILDMSLPEEEKKLIMKTLQKYEHKFVEFHELRTRRAGAERHIDLHLVIAHHLSVGQVHEVCDEIESTIKQLFPRCKVLIHAEPCDGSCERCNKDKNRSRCSYN
ncbi:MAG: cation transporter [Firmicutes bacterium]|nr:cation transporter [Bacillota bacterium]